MVRYRQNLHTHSIYCDGKDSPEEMISRALELGFDTIGFSGHSYMHFSPYCRGKEAQFEEYRKVIPPLKEKYRSKINVLCGLEFDMYSVCDMTGYDYMIGSMHYFKIGDEYVGFDRDANAVAEVIEKYFDNDGMKYVKAYYEGLTHLHEYGKFDIVGHFDLITKHCENHQFFDVESKEYRNAALEALHAVAEKFDVFEVNTGAIARGYRTAPYPAPFLLKELKALNRSVILTSDCHDNKYLDCEYDSALDLIRSCGFSEAAVWTQDGFQGMKI